LAARYFLDVAYSRKRSKTERKRRKNGFVDARTTFGRAASLIKSGTGVPPSQQRRERVTIGICVAVEDIHATLHHCAIEHLIRAMARVFAVKIGAGIMSQCP
jgi:hypothetical protein